MLVALGKFFCERVFGASLSRARPIPSSGDCGSVAAAAAAGLLPCEGVFFFDPVEEDIFRWRFFGLYLGPSLFRGANTEAVM